jgi:hypothetical protein
MARSVLELFSIKTAVGFFNQAIDVATSLGLITTTWRVGDPTLTQFTALSRMLAAGEKMRADFAKAGFLADAEGDWLKLRALDVYGVTAEEATYATSTLSLVNTGGGFYDEIAGASIFKSSVSGKSYRSETPFSLHGLGATATVDVVALEPGSDSSAAANEIDTMVTTLLGVEVTASTTAVGVDEQSKPEIVDQCLATLGALSPDGPADAYRFVALNSKLTGVVDVTRAAPIADDTSGDVAIYIAGAAGPVSVDSIAAVQAAIERWAKPLCIKPTVFNAVSTTINVTASIRGTNLPADAAAIIATKLGELFQTLPIGATKSATVGYSLDPTTITTAIRNAVPEIEGVPTYTPASPVNILASHVPVLGTVNITVI